MEHDGDAGEFDLPTEVDGLIDRWCERRELGFLAALLPVWLSNDDSRDAWLDVLAALRTIRASRRLPEEEDEVVAEAVLVLDIALHLRPEA